MAFDASRFDASKLYDRYAVAIRFREKLCGGVPKAADSVLHDWIKAKTGYDDDQTKEQVKVASEQMIDEEAEKSWMGFYRDEDHGLFIESRQVKAMFKEAATMLRITTSKLGSKQIFQHGFEVKGAVNPTRIYLGQTEPDGFREGPIHVTTAQGPRTAWKRVDYVERVELKFDIWVLGTHAQEKRHIAEEDLVRMLTFDQENGLGADRSQLQGKFDVTDFEVIAKAELPKPKGVAPKGKEKAA